jgi:hypothetical protein
MTKPTPSVMAMGTPTMNPRASIPTELQIGFLRLLFFILYFKYSWLLKLLTWALRSGVFFAREVKKKKRHTRDLCDSLSFVASSKCINCFLPYFRLKQESAYILELDSYRVISPIKSIKQIAPGLGKSGTLRIAFEMRAESASAAAMRTEGATTAGRE